MVTGAPKAGIGAEGALHDGVLGRHHVPPLWLIHSGGRQGRSMTLWFIE